MEEPVDVRRERVETTSSPPPPPGGPPVVPAAATATSYVATRSTVAPAGFRARQTVWVLLIIVDLILALRFVFFAAGAHDTGFAHAMYAIGAALDAPFRGIFNTTLDPSGHPLQWADLLAIVIYSVAAWIVNKLILIASTPSAKSPATP